MSDKEFEPGQGYSLEDWEIVSDNPEWTNEDLRSAKPFGEVFPQAHAEIKRAKRGRPQANNPKEAISIRLDQEVLEKFRATGKGWQGRINDVLARADV